MWSQHTLYLPPKSRGFHLVTDEIVAQLSDIKQLQVGLLHLFVQHTSASITLNENCDPSVRRDMEQHLSRSVPQQHGLYEHDYEGADDMPAHIKSSLFGASVSIPIQDGRLMLGTWQGIYFGEHRDHAGGRQIIATLQGQAH